MTKAKTTAKKATKKATKAKRATTKAAQEAAAKAKIAADAKAKEKAAKKAAEKAEKEAEKAKELILSAAERRQRKSLETKVRNGQLSFVDQGAALNIIRSDRLYRDTHDNFDLYCSDVFDMTRVRSTQLISASRIYTMLKAQGFKTLPVTESQCRPFSKVPKDKADKTIISIWKKIDKAAGRVKITADFISGVVADSLGINKKGAPPTGDAAGTTAASKGDTDDQQTAADAMRETIRTLKAKVAHLESALRSEKTAHARTKTMKGAGAAIPTTKLAKDLFQAGYRVLAKAKHPDHGGDETEMKELNELFVSLKNA